MSETRRRRIDLVGLAFVVAAVAVAAWAFADELPEVGAALARIGWLRSAGAALLAVAGLLATAEVWRHCLGALGSTVRPGAARRIFFPAQVGKYLPGAVWPFLAQVRLAKAHGVPSASALLAGAVFLAVHTVTAAVVSTGLLIGGGTVADNFGWAWLAAPLTLPLLHPRVVSALVRKLGRFDDGAAPPRLTWSGLVRPLLWMVPAWTCYGAALLLVAAPLAADTGAVAAVSAGAFALGWLVGLLVVIAPAGVGAREAVLVLVLGPLLGVPAAVSVGLVLRVCHTAGDVFLGLAYGLRVQRRAPSVT